MDDRSFEDRLRIELQEAASGVEVAPMAPPVRTRTRRRQVIGVAAVLVAVVAVAAVAVTAVSALRDTSPDVAGPAGEADPRASGGTYPCSHPDLDGECIAHGEYDGTEWWIGAHLQGDDLCTSDAQEERNGLGGSGMGCGPYDPDKIGFGVSSSEEHPHGIASGEVAADVARLVLERDEGEPIELQLYPAPDGFPLDVRFYNVFLPEDSRELVAYDEQGREVARQDARVMGFDLARQREVVTPGRMIGSGDFKGHPWTLHAREEMTGGAITPCYGIRYGAGEEFGGGASCAQKDPADDPLAFAQSSFEGRAAVAVFGSVHRSAESVRVELDDGRSYETILVTPDGFRTDVAFYIVWLDPSEGSGVAGSVVAVDADGNELGREKLCDEAPPGSTCA